MSCRRAKATSHCPALPHLSSAGQWAPTGRSTRPLNRGDRKLDCRHYEQTAVLTDGCETKGRQNHSTDATTEIPAKPCTRTRKRNRHSRSNYARQGQHRGRVSVGAHRLYQRNGVLPFVCLREGVRREAARAMDEKAKGLVSEDSGERGLFAREQSDSSWYKEQSDSSSYKEQSYSSRTQPGLKWGLRWQRHNRLSLGHLSMSGDSSSPDTIKN